MEASVCDKRLLPRLADAIPLRARARRARFLCKLTMHELSIAMRIVDVAQEESQRRGGVQIKAVHLRLGVLSGVVKDALLSSYEMAGEGAARPGSPVIVGEGPGG